MKIATKLLTFVMVLALLAMPMAGLAEGAAAEGSKQITVSLENVVFGMGAGSPITMDFGGLKGELTFGGDVEGGRGLLAAKLLANGKEALSGVAALEDGKITGVINGLNKAFQISEADVSAALGASAESAEDVEQMKELFSAYAAYMSKENIEELQKAYIEVLGDMSQIKGYTEAGEEEIELFGEKVKAKKYDVNMTNEDFQALMDKAVEVTMNNAAYKRLIDVTNKLVSEEDQISEENMSQLVDAEDQISEENMSQLVDAEDQINEESMSQLVDAVYSDVAITGTAWQVDEEHMKMDIDFTVTIDPSKADEALGVTTAEKEEPVTVAYHMVAAMAGSKADGVMTMDMGEEGKADITFKADETETEAATTTTFEMGMNIADTEETLRFTFSGDETVGKDGTYALNMGLNGNDGVTNLGFGMSYTGTETQENGATTHAGTVSLSMNMMGEVLSVSGDVAMREQPLPEGKLLDVTGMEIVDPLTLNEEQMGALGEEVQRVVLNAMTALKEVPALQQIINIAASGATEVTEMETSAIGGADAATDIEVTDNAPETEPEDDAAAAD